MKKKLPIILILLLAFFLRLYGLNWDQGHHLHPDERFLTMVGTAIEWPKNIAQYLNTETSPLNPYNKDFGFFVYGTFPLFLTKAVAGSFGLDNYANFNLVGRVLSAFADVGAVVFLYLISRNIWASLVYTLMVLPIQLAHFFAVDTFLVFFLVGCFYFLIRFREEKELRKQIKKIVLAGAFLGLATASKISALLFLLVAGIFFLDFLLKKKDWKKTFLLGGVFLFALFLNFRFFNPYAFSGWLKINPLFIDNLKTLASFSDPQAAFPPAVQWIKTKPLWFPFKNLFFWGLGVPLATLALLALGKSLVGQAGLFKKKKPELAVIVPLAWILSLFFYQGVQFVKTMRYFLPLYPFIALLAGDFLLKLKEKLPRLVFFLLLISLFIYPLAFMAIYAKKHSRVTASEWIYENIPSGSTISCEHWDDCLPLAIDNKNPGIYKTEVLHLYDFESEEKWQIINEQLERVDYLILSSNRLWGSIPKVPERYPQTAGFYEKLFAGELGLTRVAEITSFPSLLGIQINDSGAEEAFTVYDHPQVIVFKKK